MKKLEAETLYFYKSWSFLNDWLIASVLVWPATVVFGAGISLCLFLTVGIVINLLLKVWPVGPSASIYGLNFYLAAIVGLCVGVFQRRAIHKQFDWHAPYWIRLTIIGGAVATVLFTAFEQSTRNTMNNFYFDYDGSFYAVLMIVYVTGISAAQWFSLRHRVHSAWVWILANAVGGLAWASLFMNEARLPDTFFRWLIATLALGAITGGVLLWLFQTTPVPDKSPIAYYEVYDPPESEDFEIV